MFDALNWPNAIRAWMTTNVSPDLRPVTTQRAWVGLSRNGNPPEDDAEIIRLSGLNPSANGLIRVPYIPDAEAESFSIMGFGFTTPATRARWGMLVLEFQGDT